MCELFSNKKKLYVLKNLIPPIINEDTDNKKKN